MCDSLSVCFLAGNAPIGTSADIYSFGVCALEVHTHTYIHTYMKVLDHVVPREKRSGALDSCFGRVGPHQQSISQLLSLASQVYKGYQERSTCIYYIYALVKHQLLRVLGSLGFPVLMLLNLQL